MRPDLLRISGFWPDLLRISGFWPDLLRICGFLPVLTGQNSKVCGSRKDHANSTPQKCTYSQFPTFAFYRRHAKVHVQKCVYLFEMNTHINVRIRFGQNPKVHAKSTLVLSRIFRILDGSAQNFRILDGSLTPRRGSRQVHAQNVRIGARIP